MIRNYVRMLVDFGSNPVFFETSGVIWGLDAWVSDSSRHDFARATIMELVLWQVFEFIACVLSIERYSPCETRAF